MLLVNYQKQKYAQTQGMYIPHNMSPLDTTHTRTHTHTHTHTHTPSRAADPVDYAQMCLSACRGYIAHTPVQLRCMRTCTAMMYLYLYIATLSELCFGFFRKANLKREPIKINNANHYWTTGSKGIQSKYELNKQQPIGRVYFYSQPIRKLYFAFSQREGCICSQPIRGLYFAFSQSKV